VTTNLVAAAAGLTAAAATADVETVAPTASAMMADDRSQRPGTRRPGSVMGQSLSKGHWNDFKDFKDFK